MHPIFLFYGLGVILCSLAVPILSFSHGASHASCREMIPGHIRAHPLDPQHSHVGLRTSASSYLPGQIITVTVRGSRDFLGFLLQARSVEVRKSSARGRVGMKSTRPGFHQVGGSWIMTPPGTHTLHCFSEGDTVTHSDKQRKRNLTFLWRAPDAPMGDIQFHITVVQSYFVYWAGIESAVVRDGSRRAWKGSNTTVSDGTSTENATSPQGLKAPNKQRTRSTSPTTTLGQGTKTNSRNQTTKSLKTFTDVSRPALKSTSSVTLPNQATSKRNALILGPSQSNSSDTTPASLSSEETGTSSVSHTNDPKSVIHFTPSDFPIDVRKTDASATLSPNTIEQISIGHLSPLTSPVPFFPLNDVKTEGKELTINDLEPKLSTDPSLKDASLTFKPTTATSTTHGIGNTSTPTTTNQSRPGKLETETRPEEVSLAFPAESLMSTIQAKIGASSSKPALLSNSDGNEGSLYSQSSPKPQTSPPKPVIPSSSPTLESFPTQAIRQSDNSLSGPKSTPKQTNLSQTSSALSSTTQSHTLSSFNKSVPESLTAKDEALTQSSVAPPLHVTSGFDRLFTLRKDLKSQSTIEATSPVFGFSATPSLSHSTFPYFESSSSPSAYSLNTSSIIHPGAEPLRLPSGASTLASMRPSVRSTSVNHFFSSSLKSQPKTAPALSPVPTPSPVSTPLQLSSVQTSSISPQLSFFNSSAISSSNTSNYPSLDSSVTLTSLSTLLPFNSSKCMTNATSSSPSFTMAPATTSSSMATSTLAPSFFSSTPTSSSINEGSSSSFTSPDLGPSPAPRRSLHTPLTSLTTSYTSGQTYITTTHAEPDFNPTTQRTVVHPNPKPYPNLRLNHGQGFKPKIPSVDTKPSNPAETPNKEGKYPDIIPRHSSWELGMLLGCSAGLGMVLVIGVRYMYRKACGRRTEVTLNDREREYERGDRGLIHVQECGDLVRVRKIRENSFVLLTEYDVLASPGN